jgi:hypothetical protein
MSGDDAAQENEPVDTGRLKLVLFDDIKPRLKSNYIVKGVIGDGEMSVTYGDSGSGKTFFELDMSLHVAAGLMWRGRRVRQGGVVYVAAEGGHGINNRVEAFKRHHGIRGSIPFAAVPCAVDLLNPTADTKPLINLIKVAAKHFGMPVKLVVIDTLSRAMAGGNENAPDDMGAYVRNVDHIRERTGAHLANVHHSGKDAAKGARGHSLLRAATDTEIEVSRDSVTKVATARVMKQKELPTEGEFAFKLESIELGRDEDDDPVTSCVVTAEDDVTVEARPKLTGKALLGFRKLADCINDLGVTLPPSRHIPSRVTGVTLDQWRDYLQKAGIISDGNPREQFRRIKDKLIETRRIAVWENRVWLVREVSHSTDARGGSIFHNADPRHKGQSEPCDGSTLCNTDDISDSVTSVTSCHIDPGVTLSHVTSPYRGCDGVTRDTTTDVTAGNTTANEHHHVVESSPVQPVADATEQPPNGPLPSADAIEPDRSPDGRDEPAAPAALPDIAIEFEEVDP